MSHVFEQTIGDRHTSEGQARMMTQARTQVKASTLMLAVTVVLAAFAAKDHFHGRLHGAQGERGASALEWAIIAAVAVAIVAVVAAKVTSAVNTHAANIK